MCFSLCARHSSLDSTVLREKQSNRRGQVIGQSETDSAPRRRPNKLVRLATEPDDPCKSMRAKTAAADEQLPVVGVVVCSKLKLASQSLYTRLNNYLSARCQQASRTGRSITLPAGLARFQRTPARVKHQFSQAD